MQQKLQLSPEQLSECLVIMPIACIILQKPLSLTVVDCFFGEAQMFFRPCCAVQLRSGQRWFHGQPGYCQKVSRLCPFLWKCTGEITHSNKKQISRTIALRNRCFCRISSQTLTFFTAKIRYSEIRIFYRPFTTK